MIQTNTCIVNFSYVKVVYSMLFFSLRIYYICIYSFSTIQTTVFTKIFDANTECVIPYPHGWFFSFYPPPLHPPGISLSEGHWQTKLKFFSRGVPISKFWGSTNQNTYLSLCSTICNILYPPWKIFHVANPPIPLGNFYLLTLPTHPLGISIDHLWGVWIFSGITPCC